MRQHINKNIKKGLMWLSILLLMPILGTVFYNSQIKNITKSTYLDNIKQGSLFIQKTLKDMSQTEYQTYLSAQQHKDDEIFVSGFDLKQKQKTYLEALKQGSFTLNDLVKMAHEHGYSYKQQAFDLEKSQNNKKHQQVIKQEGVENKIQQKLFSASQKKEKQPVSYYLEQLRVAGIKAGIGAAAAAAIAAAYWAAAFFSFGVTVASATAATTQAVLFGTEGAIYGATYEKYKKHPKYLAVKDMFLAKPEELATIQSVFTNARRVVGLFELLKEAYHAIKVATIAIKTGIAATSWAAPSGLAFLIVADIILNIVDIVLSAV